MICIFLEVVNNPVRPSKSSLLVSKKMDENSKIRIINQKSKLKFTNQRSLRGHSKAIPRSYKAGTNQSARSSLSSNPLLMYSANAIVEMPIADWLLYPPLLYINIGLRLEVKSGENNFSCWMHILDACFFVMLWPTLMFFYLVLVLLCNWFCFNDTRCSSCFNTSTSLFL